MVKSRRMKWAGHITYMGKRGINRGFWWGSQKERDHKEDIDIGRTLSIVLSLCKNRPVS
jgi:hypothetical protein